MTSQANPTALLHPIWDARNSTTNGLLRERQAAALATFEKLGFPDKSLEDWRYADLSKLAEYYPIWLENPASISQSRPPTTVDGLELNNAIRISFVDGIYRPELSDTLPDGIFAGSTNDLANEQPALLKETWGALAKDQESGLVSLNSAFADASVAICLTGQQIIEQPIYLNFLGTTQNISNQPRLFISLGEQSGASVIEHYTSTAAQITNAVTEIHCGAGSDLRYFKLQEEHGDSWHTASQYFALGRGAHISTAHIDLGGQFSRNDLKITLQGENSRADCSGVFIADAKRHVESRISVDHAAPNTTSRERFRGILADQARGVFNGRIHVTQVAQKTSAELTNRNLLLSPGAEINTKPELEIYADDVKCAHGSTTGQLDQQALFYLMSRGIEAEEARNMLVVAFASELVNALGIEAISVRVRQALSKLGMPQI